jgi:HEAT repeat protein
MTVMQDLQEFVDHYVSELSGPNAFSAWHSLIEAGPSALPLVIEAFHAAPNPQVKISLVKLASEYRSETAVPFLVMCLSDRRSDIWKAALDGLVILGGAAAMEGLREARTTAPRDQRHWIDDAMQQIIDYS